MLVSTHSRGPAYSTRSLLKPGIAAPGTAILAAWPPNDIEVTRPGQEPSLFNITSGTSMSCAHVSAIVATLKSRNPTWSPSAIRSTIMTTTFQQSNSKSSMIVNTVYRQYLATPYDFGAGVATMSGPSEPGLVYETEITDYLQFLCSTGYNSSTIKLISKTLPNNFSCPANLSDDSTSNMNYPSIAISMSKERETKKVTRTLTRIGDEESEYTAIITGPNNLRVRLQTKGASEIYRRTIDAIVKTFQSKGILVVLLFFLNEERVSLTLIPVVGELRREGMLDD
ncbi:hypothetical protein RND71_002545 [Anisodus tanguticus]|uniref:Uncharacterized protein n=1 Tax=Anisodus tanguticus TaxID=243964 RepID=A0AAE1T030_9SOLA|nr:hypothetical protein RND71_002545 [Anisodus tanguticus]